MLAPVIEFIPTDVPHTLLREQAAKHFQFRTSTLTAKSGVSRVRTALRTFVAEVERRRLPLADLPADFVTLYVLPVFSDPVSKKMALGEIKKFIAGLQAQGVEVAPLTYPTIDVSAAQASATARAKEKAVERREAAQRTFDEAPGAPYDDTDASDTEPNDPSEPFYPDAPDSSTEENDPMDEQMNGAAPPAQEGPAHVSTSAPARPSHPQPAAKRAGARGNSQLFPTGHKLRVWKLGDPGSDPVYVGSWPMELVKDNGGTLEDFLALVVRAQYGPFPGEPAQKYRLEEQNPQKRIINAWDIPIGAPTLPNPMASPGSPGAPAGYTTIMQMPPTTPAGATVAEQLQAQLQLHDAITERATVQAAARGASTADEVSRLQADVRTEIAASEQRIAMLVQQVRGGSGGDALAGFQVKQAEQNSQILGDITKALLEQRFAPQPAAPVAPTASAVDSMKQTMEMMAGMMALLTPLMKPKEKNEETEALLDAIQEMRDELAETKKKNPLEDFANTMILIQKITGNEGGPMFGQKDKTSFIDSFRPIVETIAKNAPDVIKAFGEMQSQQADSAIQRARLMPPQQQQQPPRPQLPATAVLRPTAPAPGHVAQPSHPPMTQVPADLAPAPVLVTPAPETTAPAPEAATPITEMNAVEALVRRKALPEDVQKALSELLAAVKGIDPEGPKVSEEKATEISTCIGDFLTGLHKRADEDAKEQRAAARKEGKLTRTEIKKMEIKSIAGSVVEGLGNLLKAAQDAKTDEEFDAAKNDLVINLHNIFHHVGYGADAPPASSVVIAEVFIAMHEEFEEEQGDIEMVKDAKPEAAGVAT